jgi:hypothetical protein
MNHKEYNGWYNYETWVINLWLDNDEGTADYWQERVQEAIEQAAKNSDDKQEVTDDASNAVEDELKSYHEDALPNLQGFAADLLNAAMSEVNWREIAEAKVTDYIADNPEVLQA